MLWIVAMKLIAPASDEMARMWSERIQRSWPFPGAKSFSESGTYAVQPVSAGPPFAKKLE